MDQIFDTSLEFALQLDESDFLNKFRKRFYIADEKTIYLDGNSLGRLPQKTEERILEITKKQWGTGLIESWNKHWYNQSVKLGNKISKLIGASDGEVVVTDSTSVNLYKLAFAALKLKKGKTQVLSDVFNFPTDLYILQGILKDFGPEYELVLANTKDDITINLKNLKEKITDKTALVVLSMVAFKSSFLYNAEEITNWAHEKGALVLWDLSHAAGAIPVELNKTNADLAVGCTYKYLNGGPGSPAFLYVRKDLLEKLNSPIQGWFGDNNPFEFNLNFKPSTGIRKFLAGTPSVISQMAIEPGLDLILEAGITNIREKSIQQSNYFIFLVHEMLAEFGFKLGSPLNQINRGSHISLKHIEAFRICKALINPLNSDIKIIPDFREPNNIRFGITPMYTTFVELHNTIKRIKEIVEKNEFGKHSATRETVT